MDCPRCGSQKTQPLKLIYQSGVTQVNVFHRLHGAGGLVRGHIQSDGSQQTLLAQSIAPPVRRSASFAGWCFVIAAMVLFDIWRTPRFGPVERFESVVAIAALVLGFVLARVVGKINEGVATEYERWLRSWLCHRCGALYTPDEQAPR